jgi:EmrB/QacA subfamily drug resistance transporter
MPSHSPTPFASTPRQRWTLALSATASFMVVLDLLVVATALDTIRRHLGASVSQLEWTVNAYTLSFAVLLMTAAALGDRVGRRRLFAIGLLVFGAASAGCALAPTAGWLIAARAVQGAGAATIMPLALALLNGAFPPEQRGRAMGVFGSVTGLAAVLGPIIGGAVTQGIAWEWIFWLNVPIAICAAPLALRTLDESFGPKARIDVAGVVLMTGGALGLVWGLVRGNAAGWASGQVLGALIGGGLLIGAFLAWERGTRAPMLPLRLFGSRAFSAGNAAIFFLNASMTGAVFFNAQFQQIALGQGPLIAGLRLLPWGLAPLLIAPRAGALSDRVGSRRLTAVGLAVQAIGLTWLAAISSAHVAYPALIAPMTLAGVGFSIAIPATTRSAVSEVAPADIGKAAGAYSAIRQLGGAFGVAILVAVFSAHGGYAGPTPFADGYGAAMVAAAILAACGALAATALPGRALLRRAGTAAVAAEPERAG